MAKKYEVTIAECSKELTARERIKLKDLADALNINTVIENEGEGIINVDYYATIEVHNEYSEDTEYQQFVIVDTEGTKYYTGSQSFIESFLNIAEELQGTDEAFIIKCYGIESKNYKGRSFLSCSLA